MSLFAACLALPGCGELGASFRGTRPQAPSAVSAGDLARQGAGSPAATVLAWCSALQHRRPVEGFYAADERRRSAVLRMEARESLFVVTAAGCPTILGTSVRGDDALVLTEMAMRREAPNGRVDVAPTRLAFNLRRSGGRWRLRTGSFRSLRFPPRPVPVDQIRPPRLVGAADLRRYPADSPERAALELLQVLQYSDPVAALPRFGREWHLSLPEVSRLLGDLAPVARGWGVPKATRTRVTGDGATVDALVAGRRAVVQFRRRAGRWVLVRFRFGSLDVPKRDSGR